MSELTPDFVEHLARLARLDLSQEERERFAVQLNSVVEYVAQLPAGDTVTGQGVSGLANVYAEDQFRSEEDPYSISRGELLAGAAPHNDGYIVVRAVLGDDAGGSA